MAKSLRSKWRRKCRAVKRVRYGEKELARLKKTLGIDENASKDVEMSDIQEIATVTNAQAIKENKNKKVVQGNMEDEEMDDGTAKVYSKKTMKDQYGNYPVWINRRKLMKHKKGRAKTKKGTIQRDKKVAKKQKKRRTKGKEKIEQA
ncbi:protein LLP homolog [Copidosoma floridanum]|uniref:protein LLP homolog n=1 Tax=Copidosoma floridanum TaxID=29053 RepID=UPI0006C9528D|nr:protein LLP homolog [Copidosoma floridanum]